MTWRTVASIGGFDVRVRPVGDARVLDRSTGRVLKTFVTDGTPKGARRRAVDFAWAKFGVARHAAATRKAVAFWSAGPLVLAA